MMHIEINGTQFELQTNLLAIKRVEAKLGVSVMGVFQAIENATCEELLTVIRCGFPPSAKDELAEFNCLADAYWDLMDLYWYAQEMVMNMLFTGTDAQKEAKLEKMGVPEDRKNAIRELLGMAKPATP